MTLARRLAAFLTETTVADLPPQTFEHAAMLIASTLASAACGTKLDSARIIRDLARDGGGRPDQCSDLAGVSRTWVPRLSRRNLRRDRRIGIAASP